MYPTRSPSVIAAGTTQVASGWMPTGNAQPWSRRNEGPLSVATRTPFTLPPAQPGQKWERRDRKDSSETQSPQGRVQKEGPGRRSRGHAGNLPHSGSLRAPPLSRPVAPQSASYRDVVATHGRRRSSADERPRGLRAGGGVGRCAQSGQVPVPESRGQTRPGRASAGARGCECAMRARRGECVSPLSPSFPASPLARLSSERPPKPQPL